MPLRILLSLLLAWWQSDTLNQISLTNRARKDAEQAYRAGNYARAAAQFAYVMRHTASAPDPGLLLNLGQAHFQLGQYKPAAQHYGRLLALPDAPHRALAASQLGVLAGRQRDTLQAIHYFLQALRLDPDHEPARYNFELLKRTYVGRRPARKTSSARGQQERPQPAPGQDVERSARQDELLRRFRALNMTEAQVRQLLDAMQNDDQLLLRSSRQRAGNVAENNRW